MGMDVYGTREDTYFRNNVWWWRPLWNYVNETCDLSDEDFNMGLENNGHFISKKKSDEISKILFEEVKSKRTHAYMLSRNKRLKSLPLVDCIFCNGTGTRTDINEKGNDCNGCNTGHHKEDGLPLGKVKSRETHYVFDVNNVKKFAKFCKESDGFEIC